MIKKLMWKKAIIYKTLGLPNGPKNVHIIEAQLDSIPWTLITVKIYEIIITIENIVVRIPVQFLLLKNRKPTITSTIEK